MPFFPPFLFPPSVFPCHSSPSDPSSLFYFLFPSLPPSDLPSLSCSLPQIAYLYDTKSVLEQLDEANIITELGGKLHYNHNSWLHNRQVRCCSDLCIRVSAVSGQELMSGMKERHEGSSNYHTLVDPILCWIWHPTNAPYKVSCIFVKKPAASLVTAGELLRIHSSNLKIC